jgi:8-oxo-dGTP pyrophosphatase MutT (NUDIX family)
MSAGFAPTELLGSVHSIAQALETMASLSNASLTARLLYPDDVTAVVARSKGALDSLSPFEGLQLVPLDRTFADFATETSGAPILVDASRSRSGVAVDVRVLHSRSYRGAGCVGTYEDHHSFGPCAAGDEVVDPTDYDGRALDLHRVELARHPARGELVFLLATGETCYAATEHRDKAWACKRLRRLEPGSSPGVEWTNGRRGGSRLSLLTSYVAVLTADGSLVLCARSRNPRNALGALSATGGGVCEPGSPVSPVDANAFGWPDPIATGVRELREEVGLVVDRNSVRPVAVFLANSMGEREGGLYGQVVPTVLSVAHSSLSFEQIRDNASHSSDLAHGSYEVAGLEEVPMRDLSEVATWARDQSDRLDQHGLLSIIYAARLRWGPDEVASKFQSEFASRPWWRSSSAAGGDRRWAPPTALAPSDSAPKASER